MHKASSSPLREPALNIPQASRMNKEKVSKAIEALKNEGSLTIVDASDGAGCSVAFKRVDFVDKLRAFFAGSRQKKVQAEQACNAIRKALDLPDGNHWLLNNIRAKIKSDGMISGDYLAKNLEAISSGIRLDYRLNANALTSERGVGLVNLSPADISSDCTVVSFDEGLNLIDDRIDSMQANVRPDIDSQYNNGYSQQEVDSARESAKLYQQETGLFSLGIHTIYASKILVFRESEDEPFPYESLTAAITDIAEKAGGGSVVMRPLRDPSEQVNKSGAHQSGYSDENLKEQLRVAHQINDEASKGGGTLRITFASTDVELMKRMRDLYAEVKRENDSQ